MTYNWQQSDWPEFQYELSGLQDLLYAYAEKTGRVSGALQGLNKDDQTEMVVELMVAEALKTSAIEGEMISREDIRSSVRNRLGLNSTPKAIRDVRARGIAELMVLVRQDFAEPLTAQMMFDWHHELMAHDRRLVAGQWRTHEEPMQVISGPIGKGKVHYEAPPSAQVPAEMARFISWFNDTAPGGALELKYGPVRAAIAHVYFESIHPFEDGNGRIGRALSEKALGQSLGRPVMLSLSEIIERSRDDYYEALKAAQRSNVITDWLVYFVGVILQAQERTEAQIEFVIQKARFFDRFRDQLSERELRVVRRMLDNGPEGFEGGINARKYVSIAKVSKATATRDLQRLVEIGVLVPVGAGRATRYALNLSEENPSTA